MNPEGNFYFPENEKKTHLSLNYGLIQLLWSAFQSSMGILGNVFVTERKLRKGSLLSRSREGEEIERVRMRMKIKLYREKII